MRSVNVACLAWLATLSAAAPSLDPQRPLDILPIFDASLPSSNKHSIRPSEAQPFDLIDLHKSLVSIPSVSYTEYNISKWLASTLEAKGYSTELQQLEDTDRYNVLAWPGKNRNARTLITSHIDTVPPFYPYGVHSNDTDTVITGRGSVDAKASVAAQIIATTKLISDGHVDADDVNLLYVVGEEVSGDGMRAANSLKLTPDTIIFGEPTEGKLAAGHKGMLGFTIVAKGKASHSGYPWLGRSANEIMVKALSALMDVGAKLPTSDKYGQTTINLGRIDGGVAANVVAETASAKIAVRIAAGTPEGIKANITKAITAAVKEYQSRDDDEVIEFQWASAGYAPVDIDHDVEGFETFTVNYGTDIPNFEQTVEGQKRYLYGPGSILVAHSDHEAITVGELEEAVEGYKRLILHSLKEQE
ncbi:hypothetical protein AAFC00_003616 [Neodothiora populina]|uniref:Peptidase M20 dimerisation domain-containing protein n=1 Tax=Neodothiora populina TaxID=2781224 RepID=A0ABR3PF00_9PEZI